VTAQKRWLVNDLLYEDILGSDVVGTNYRWYIPHLLLISHWKIVSESLVLLLGSMKVCIYGGTAGHNLLRFKEYMRHMSATGKTREARPRGRFS
jgi:hypothetical protein